MLNTFLHILKSEDILETVKGVKASAIVYSIVETAKANGLDVYKYLQYLLEFIPSVDFYNKSEFLNEIMPWLETVKKYCAK